MKKGSILVFGSNLSGIHGAGAARAAAVHYGAIWKQGEGPMGASYALPTKGINISFMPLDEVKKHVDKFLAFAEEHSYMTFQVTRVGCGLAGFKDIDIASLFEDAPLNCEFDTEWMKHIPKSGRVFWGTF